MGSVGLVLLQCIFYLLCSLCVGYTGFNSYKYFLINIRQHQWMWYFALIIFICVTLSFLTSFIFSPLITFKMYNYNLCPIFCQIQVILSSLFKTCLYLFFLQRIHNTFQFTIHSIRPIFIHFLRILTISYWSIVTIIQCTMIYPSMIIMNVNNNIYFCDLNDISIKIKMDILFISDCIAESILCPLLLLLFIRGLYSVVSTRKNLSIKESQQISNSISTINSCTATRRTTNKSKSKMDEVPSQSQLTLNRSGTISQDGYDYNNKIDRNFVYAITKFTNLANISFITSIAVYLILLICKLFITNHIILALQLPITLIFDQMINSFCVYLVFRFTDNKYHKYCKYTHKLQILCMIAICPKTKPMFEVAKLNYQQKQKKCKLGLPRYPSNAKDHNKINKNNENQKENNDGLETVPENGNDDDPNNTNIIIQVIEPDIEENEEFVHFEDLTPSHTTNDMVNIYSDTERDEHNENNGDIENNNNANNNEYNEEQHNLDINDKEIGDKQHRIKLLQIHSDEMDEEQYENKQHPQHAVDDINISENEEEHKKDVMNVDNINGQIIERTDHNEENDDINKTQNGLHDDINDD